MKCFADNRDYCKTPENCKYLNDCAFFPVLEKNKKPRIPEFLELIEKSKEIHIKKNKDYASSSNPFSNFERSAELISWFANSTDKAFIALIATKLARIAELSFEGREPNNESLDDSFLDLVTYCVLWGAYRKRKANNEIKVCAQCGHQQLVHTEIGCRLCLCTRSNGETTK